MPSCSVVWCGNRTGHPTKSNVRVSYHNFPKEAKLRNIWIKATGRQDSWIPPSNAKICSKHFRPDLLSICSGKLTKLSKWAVPTLNLPFYVREDGTTSLEEKNDYDNLQIVEHRQEEDLTDYLLSKSESLTQQLKENDIKDESDIQSSSANCIKLELEEKNSGDTKPDVECKHEDVVAIKQKTRFFRKLKIKPFQHHLRKNTKKKANLEKILRSLTEKSLISADDVEILHNMSVTVSEIVKRELHQNEVQKKSKQKYSPSLKSFAVTLHYYSPKGYDFVRKTFNTCLPAENTLRNWYKNIDGNPGFTKEALAGIAAKAKASSKKIYVALMFDEMKLCEKEEYVPNEQKQYGYVDFGAEINMNATNMQSKAREALVFLVVAINGSWKVPVGYFLTNGVSGSQKYHLVQTAIYLLEETGVDVVSLTFDAQQSNIAMARLLGCSFDPENLKTTFQSERGKNISIFFDPCHMIKLIRNAFEFYKEFLDGDKNKVSWHYLDELQSLNLGNKLTREHIDFKNTVMPVRLATKIFSRNVSLALSFCKNELNYARFEEVDGTVGFTEAMNDILDILNSRVNGRDLKGPINKFNKTKVFNTIDKLTENLKKMTITNNKNNASNEISVMHCSMKWGFIGLCVAAQSAKVMAKQLLDEGLHYVPLQKISQDAIELFFCNIRSRAEAMTNPTPRQFKNIYKSILVHTNVMDRSGGNCVPLENISILDCKSSVDKINLTTRMDTDDISIFNNENDNLNADNIDYCDIELSEFSNSVVEYIAGFVVFVLKNKIKCQNCVPALIGKPNQNSLITKRTSRGKLCCPSDDVTKICKIAEVCIKQSIAECGGLPITTKYTTSHLVTKTLQKTIGMDLFKSIEEHQFDTDGCSNHIVELCKCVVTTYINTRLTYITKSQEKISPRQRVNNLTQFCY